MHAAVKRFSVNDKSLKQLSCFQCKDLSQCRFNFSYPDQVTANPVLDHNAKIWVYRSYL